MPAASLLSIGWKNPLKSYTTVYVQVAASLPCPTLSSAVPAGTVAVCVPTALVLSEVDPVAPVFSPDCPSFACHVALALAPFSTGPEGRVAVTFGLSASTCTVRLPADDSLSATSSTVPLAVCEPLVLNVLLAGTVAVSTPLPGSLLLRSGSPADAKPTVTVSLNQPPPPA